MVEIRGFRGLVFNPSVVGPLSQVLAPPYDVITPEDRNRLIQTNAYNITRLTLPEAEGGVSPYETAALLLKHWLNEGAVLHDGTPHIYLLRQKFFDSNGKRMERRSFLALLRLPEPGEKIILGHEKTFDAPVEDRLRLIRAVQANLEPIFIMYSDPGLRLSGRLFAKMEETPPFLTATTLDGVAQELWRATLIPDVADHFQHQTLYIADGHHRFKTSCTYWEEQKKSKGGTDYLPAAAYILTGLVAFEEPGLKVFATHRVLPASFPLSANAVCDRLRPYFDIEALPRPLATIQDLHDSEQTCHMIMDAGSQGCWHLTLRESMRENLLATDRDAAWKALDVSVLHRGILERLLNIGDLPLLYEKDEQKAKQLVDEGLGSIAFLLRPTKSEQVRACAQAYESMPQKSTYYFPKMPSGAVIYTFNNF